MKNIFTTSCVLIAQAAQAATVWDDMNSMAYAYHISRHGARSLAVLVDVTMFGVDLSDFPVEPGELTPQGMR